MLGSLWQEMVDFLVDVWEQEGLYDWAGWWKKASRIKKVNIFQEYIGFSIVLSSSLLDSSTVHYSIVVYKSFNFITGASFFSFCQCKVNLKLQKKKLIWLEGPLKFGPKWVLAQKEHVINQTPGSFLFKMSCFCVIFWKPWEISW